MKSAVISGSVKEIVFDEALLPIGCDDIKPSPENLSIFITAHPAKQPDLSRP